MKSLVTVESIKADFIAANDGKDPSASEMRRLEEQHRSAISGVLRKAVAKAPYKGKSKAQIAKMLLEPEEEDQAPRFYGILNGVPYVRNAYSPAEMESLL